MELSKFEKKIKKCQSKEDKCYFLIFDRYHYKECYQTYQDFKNTMKEITSLKHVNYMNPNETCINEAENYLSHMDMMYKLKQMGYLKVE